jgi:hypothetical protein
VSRVSFHTSTAALCGDLKARDSAEYPISYRFYGAFCALDQDALAAQRLTAAPLYYGIWAYRQVPPGQFVNLDLADTDLGRLRAYGTIDRAGRLTVVLINIQDPAGGGEADEVTVNLPAPYGHARQVTLASSAPGGLTSTDPGAITLGGQTVSDGGVASGRITATDVPVTGTSATVSVAPGTAQIITFSR